MVGLAYPWAGGNTGQLSLWESTMVVGNAAPSVLDVADDELALRVCGPTRHGQVVRLKSRKCTIGSGPRCTLRLRARGVQSLHCLVLRGPGATVIRRFSPDTRINGHAFTDTSLAPGDRLSIGPIDFDVLGADALAAREAPPAPRLPRSDPPALARPDGPPQDGADPVAAKQHARARTRRMIRALREARKEIANFKQQHQRWERERSEAEQALPDRQQETDARQAELDAHRNELDARQEALESERRQWTGQQEAALAKLNERANELDRRHAELDRAQEEFQQQRDQWDTERTDAERKAQQRCEELAQRAQQLDAQVDEARARRSESDSRQGKIEARQTELDARQADLDSRQTELDARQADLDSRQTALKTREAEIEEKWRRFQAELAAAERERQAPAGPADEEEAVQFESPTGGSPGSAESVLRQMGIARSFDEDEAEDAATPASPQAQSAPQTPDAPHEPTAEEDESIDDYMARLLERVRQTAGPGGKPTGQDPSPGAPAPSPADSQAPPQPTDSPSPASEPTDSPTGGRPAQSSGLSPRAAAPERSVDLSAMRDLANLSAQAAIDHYSRRVLFSRSAGKLMVAVVALAASTALLWIWWAKSSSLLPLHAGVASLAIALLYGGHYLVLGARLLLTRRRRGARSRADKTAVEAEGDADSSSHRPADTGEPPSLG
jgi:hypothetical protein